MAPPMKDYQEHKKVFEEYWRETILTHYKTLGSESIFQAISYALEGEGKRTRPIFILALCESLEIPTKNALICAAAVEMMHIYSLVHDDLPCMDNDDYRRGRLTVHRKFDEALALLVGDSLITESIAWLIQNLDAKNDIIVKIINTLIHAAGCQGMVLGQNLDLFFTNKQADQRTLEKIHQKKTGELFGVCFAIPLILAQATPLEIEQAKNIGVNLGLAFQMMDDLLDKTTETGKSQGKDEAQNKLTILKFLSPEQVTSNIKDLVNKSLSHLEKIFSGRDISSLKCFVEKTFWDRIK